MKLVELIKDYPDLVEQLNKLLPDDMKLKKLSNHELGHDSERGQMDMQSLFQELSQRCPDKLQRIIELIQDIKSSNNNKELSKEILSDILHDEPVLLDLFTKQLKLDGEDNRRNYDGDNAGENSNSVHNYQDVEDDEYPRARAGRIPRGQPGRRLKPGKRGKRTEFEPGIQSNVPREPVATVLPPTIRNELYLFEYLQNQLSKENYEEFIKIIYLYIESVITSSEVFALTKHLFEGNENYFSFFREIIVSREITRRKNTTYFKPLNEIDFKKLGCERNGSYTKLPPNMPIMRCPPNSKNPLSNQVLNTTWVSVPTGSEVNFVVNSKNSYEENLFKGEDERYEFDNTIYTYTATIKWLKSMETLQSEEKIQEIANRILRLKVLHRVYAGNTEILEIFKKTPQKIAKVLAERIESKLKEVKDTKANQAKAKWHETSEQNFHRSLDHRSFYFKHHEKKFTSHKHFLNDSLHRHKHIHQVGDPHHHHDKYWGIFNTFEGISNGVQCGHPTLNNEDLLKEIQSPEGNKKIYPIFRLTFDQKQISQDIYDMLVLRLQSFHVNQSDREKIQRYLKVFMFELMQFNYQNNSNKYDTVISEKTLLNVVSRIESKIYDKSFSFNTAKVDEMRKNLVPEETIYSAIEKSKELSTAEKIKDEEEEKANKIKAEVPNGENAHKDTGLKPEEEHGRNRTESLEDELRLDSGSEEPLNVKEMEYVDGERENQTLFVPPVKKDQVLFYGTQQLFFLVRFYYTLYERFLKAFEIANEFDSNPKSDLLTDSEKRTLAVERYDAFKWILVHLIRNNIENEKFEDYLRSIFGTKAYLMFCIDKIIHTIIITIQKLGNDEVSPKVLNLFTESDLQSKHPERAEKNIQKKKNWPEHVYLAQLNSLTLNNMNCLQNTHFYRFLYDPRSQLMTVSLYDSPYKDWNEKLLQSAFAYSEPYLIAAPLGNCEKHSLNSVFLKRNKDKNKKRITKKGVNVLVVNNIDWKYIPNTFKLVTGTIDKEDMMIAQKKKSKSKEELQKVVLHEVKRIKRFRAWHKQALPNLNK